MGGVGVPPAGDDPRDPRLADGLDEEALRFVGVRRDHHLQPRDVREDGVEALRVLGGCPEAGADPGNMAGVSGQDGSADHRLPNH